VVICQVASSIFFQASLAKTLSHFAIVFRKLGWNPMIGISGLLNAERQAIGKSLRQYCFATSKKEIPK
jgi:hypothetical protein